MSKTRDSSDGQSAGQKAASTWVQNPELKSTLRSIWKLENDASAALELFRKEAATEVELAKNMSITPKDLIQDRKTLASLSLLYTSMVCFKPLRMACKLLTALEMAGYESF